MKESKLRVAIISAGMITNAAHIPAYQNLKDRADLVAVCDLNPVSAEGTAQRHGIPHWYTDAETMLRECKPDLVSVCTPNASHKAMAMLALEHGCHVACEKPLALTYRDTRELFDFAREKGRVLIACQTTTNTSSRGKWQKKAVWEKSTIPNSPSCAAAAFPNGAPSIAWTPTAADACAIWAYI